MSSVQPLYESPAHVVDVAPEPPQIKRQRKLSLFDGAILRRALRDAFAKLSPRRMAKP